MTQTFSKPPKSSEEFIQHWEGKGLIIPDKNRTQRYLEHIGYYRLSSYAVPFKKLDNSTQLSSFIKGTTFEQILSLYIFDRELRLLTLDALERIEITIRSQICNTICDLTSDAFWYLDGQYFKNSYHHSRLLSTIEKQILDEMTRLEKDQKQIDKNPRHSTEQKEQLKTHAQHENHIREYISKYQKSKLPPTWIAIEMLTWGDLSHLYSGLSSNQHKKAIAKQLGLHAEVLESWLKTLNDVRNICAHHNRLWNREFGRNLKEPKSNTIIWLKEQIILQNPNIRYEKRFYIILVALQNLLYNINPNSSWAMRLYKLMEKYPATSKSHMGMPNNWYKDDFWHKVITQP